MRIRPATAQEVRCLACVLLPVLVLIVTAIAVKLLAPSHVGSICASSERQSKVRKLIVDVARCFDRCGMTYFLDSGTLLGALRQQDVIEYDYDADFGLLCRNYSKLMRHRECAAASQTRIVAHSVGEPLRSTTTTADNSSIVALLNDAIPCDSNDVFDPFVVSSLARCLRDSNLGVRLLPRAYGTIKLWHRLPGEEFGVPNADTGSPHLDVQLYNVDWSRGDRGGESRPFLQLHVGRLTNTVSAVVKQKQRRPFEAEIPPRCEPGDGIIFEHTGFCVPRLAENHVASEYGATWRTRMSYNPVCWLKHFGWLMAIGYSAWVLFVIRRFRSGLNGPRVF